MQKEKLKHIVPVELISKVHIFGVRSWSPRSLSEYKKDTGGVPPVFSFTYLKIIQTRIALNGMTDRVFWPLVKWQATKKVVKPEIAGEK